MEYFDWSEEKNKLLKTERDVSFEEVVIAIEAKKLLAIEAHTGEKFAHQQLLVVEISEYVYLVPFIYNGKKVFFKTIIPSRKATKKYLTRKE